MRIKYVIGLCSILIFSMFGCKSQSNEQIIDSVTRQVLAAIRTGHVDQFISFIGPPLSTIAKTEEMVGFDVRKYKRVLDKYIGQDSVHIIVTDLYNRLGQRLVKIPIYDYSIDSTNAKELYLPGVKTLFLQIIFGPTRFYPLNRISGYDLIRNNSDSSDFKPMQYWFPPKET